MAINNSMGIIKEQFKKRLKCFHKLEDISEE